VTGAGVPAPAAGPGTRSADPRPVRLAVRLFPTPWRERYGREFAALLEATPLTPRVLFDVLVAAVDAHLDPTGPRRRWPLMIERVRSSELAVFASWVLFVVAGLAFQRMTDGDPFTPLAGQDPLIGLAVVVLIAAAVVSLAAVVVGGVPIAAAIALTAVRARRWGLLALLAVPPIALALWVALTVILVSAGAPPPDAPIRVVVFLAWVGAFVVAAVASTIAVAAAARNADVDGTLYARAARPASLTAASIVVGAVAVAGWGLGLLGTRPDEFWGSDGLIGSSTALTWLGIVVAMAVAAAIALRAVLGARRSPPA
jgi:hypothetical protein